MQNFKSDSMKQFIDLEASKVEQSVMKPEHDVVTRMAAAALNIPADQVTKEQRRRFKTLGYTYLYSPTRFNVTPEEYGRSLRDTFDKKLVEGKKK